MLIPIYRNPEYKVGDIVISLNKISGDYYHFTPYHEFVIVGLSDNYNNSTLKDVESGIEIKAHLVRTNDFLLKTDLKTAKKRCVEVDDYYYFKKFMRKKCPHLYESIDDRQYYDACKINKHNYCDNTCEIEDTCICHIDIKEIEKDKIITRYLRRKKIKILSNE